MLTRITVLAIVISALSTASYGEGKAGPITIRGLSINSSIQEIEEVLGSCKQDSVDEAYYQCGTVRGSGDFSGYSVNESNQISGISMPCTAIEACLFSTNDLAYLLSDGLGLDEPRLVIEGMPAFGLMIDGKGGDRLFVSEINGYMFISISDYNYR